MKKEYSSIIVLTGPFIGDTLLFFSTTVFLRNKFNKIYFITYHDELITTLNPYQEIKVINIKNCIAVLSSKKKKVILSNHPGETIINGFNLPLVIVNNAINYELIDLYYRNSIFSRYKEKNYSNAMFEIISQCFNYKSSYRPNFLSVLLRRKLTRNKLDIAYMNSKYPFLAKKYIVVIECNSMNAKKFNKWDQLIKELIRTSSNNYHIITINEKILPKNFSGKAKISSIHCALKYYSYIFFNQNCHFVLSTDTGIAHLSAMLAAKTFILYAISDPIFWNNGSSTYYPVIGKKNIQHIKQIHDDYIRLDFPKKRGEELITKEGFGASLTSIKEIINCLHLGLS